MAKAGIALTDFKIHVHRANLHNPAHLKKWYAHIEAWGPDPRDFRDIQVNVPCTTVTELNTTDFPGMGCGCAQAYLVGKVPLSEIQFSPDYMTLTLGKAVK